jgi:nitrogen PTS system EIIA component
MLISDLISKSCVIPNLVGRNKEEVLSYLAFFLVEAVPLVLAERVFELFLEREKLGTTGIGNGIAIPHGRLEGIKVPIAILGRSVEGVSFDSNDGQPVHLFIALLSPVGSGKPHLKALSAISRFLSQESQRQDLLEANDQQALYEVLIQERGEG